MTQWEGDTKGSFDSIFFGLTLGHRGRPMERRKISPSALGTMNGIAGRRLRRAAGCVKGNPTFRNVLSAAGGEAEGRVMWGVSFRLPPPLPRTPPLPRNCALLGV